MLRILLGMGGVKQTTHRQNKPGVLQEWQFPEQLQDGLLLAKLFLSQDARPHGQRVVLDSPTADGVRPCEGRHAVHQLPHAEAQLSAVLGLNNQHVIMCTDKEA